MNTDLLPSGPKVGRLGQYLFASRRHDTLGFLLRLAREYGDIVHFRVGPQALLPPQPPRLHPRRARHASGEFPQGARRVIARKQFLGEGAHHAEGELHRRQRRLMQPAFHRQRIAAYTAVMVEQAARLRRALARRRDVRRRAGDAAPHARRSSAGRSSTPRRGRGRGGGRGHDGRADALPRVPMLPPSDLLEKLPLPQPRASAVPGRRLDR